MTYEFASGQRVAIIHPRGLVVAILSVVSGGPDGVRLSDETFWSAPDFSNSEDLRVVPMSPALARKIERSARLRRIGELGRIVATLGDQSTPMTDFDLQAMEDALLNGIRRHASELPRLQRGEFLRTTQARISAAAEGALHPGLYSGGDTG